MKIWDKIKAFFTAEFPCDDDAVDAIAAVSIMSGTNNTSMQAFMTAAGVEKKNSSAINKDHEDIYKP